MKETLNLTGRTILVCVCGGIAAYKVCEVASKLAQAGASVHVAMTHEATNFVGPTTFQALSANPVHTDLWAPAPAQDSGLRTQHSVDHIALAQKSDLILVAPCTANMLAKMAHGLADELVSTILLAAEPKRIVIAPAMNEQMWNHPATQRNAKQVFDDGVQFIGPGAGWQACRTIGVGRMSEPAEILEALAAKLANLTTAEQTPHFTP